MAKPQNTLTYKQEMSKKEAIGVFKAVASVGQPDQRLEVSQRLGSRVAGTLERGRPRRCSKRRERRRRQYCRQRERRRIITGFYAPPTEAFGYRVE